MFPEFSPLISSPHFAEHTAIELVARVDALDEAAFAELLHPLAQLRRSTFDRVVEPAHQLHTYCTTYVKREQPLLLGACC